MEVKNVVFEKLLDNNNFKKIDFANYSKIPYNTVAGWRKRKKVPEYAMVILKDMIYRKKLDIEAERDLRRNRVVKTRIDYRLTIDEETILKSVFWGTNYTLDDIVQNIKERNKKVIRRIEENLPPKTQRQILGKLSHA